MSWKYVQDTGCVYDPSGALVGQGYAGHAEGKNNPAMQWVRMIGPLPCGWYTIGHAQDGTHLGPCAMPLTPDPANDMRGRGDFWWHADFLDVAKRGTASLGCIVTALDLRQVVNHSHDRRLEVVSTERKGVA